MEKVYSKEESIENIKRYNRAMELLEEGKIKEALSLADFEPSSDDLYNEIENYCDACVCEIDKEWPGLVIEVLG